MNNRTLILGGGFIGQALGRRLASAGHTTAIVSRTLPEQPLPGIKWHQCDLQDGREIATLLPRFDTVVHAASTSTPGVHLRHPSQEAVENLLPLLRLLETLDEARRIRLVFLSSGGAIYGDPATLPVPETQPLTPLSYHAAGKAAAEQFLQVFEHLGHPVTILRPSNIYGPGQPLRSGFGVIRTILEHARRGTAMTIWGDGETVRDYLYIEDFLDACLAFLQDPADGIFNIGSGSGVTLNTLCRLVEAISGRPLQTQHRPSRGIDVRKIVLDVSRFKSRYGWQPRHGIEQGIGMTWEWLQAQP